MILIFSSYLYFIILYVRHISLLYQEKLKGYYKKLHSLYKRTQDLLLTSSDGRIKGLQILSSKNNTETGQNVKTTVSELWKLTEGKKHRETLIDEKLMKFS